MRMRRLRTTLVLLTLLLAMTGCLGPNNLTGQLYRWNRNVDGPWGNEILYIVIFPAYIITSAGDILIFNSWQWWFGDNPIPSPAGGANPVSG